MASLVTEDVRAKASEFYRGNDECMTQAMRLFEEFGFPNGLLPLRDVEECGYIEETGFVWLIQKQQIEHTFKKIDRKVRYATEITAHVEQGKITNLTGVQAKEILIWITVDEIHVGATESETIIFKNKATSIKRIFPTDAFVIEVKEPAQVPEEKKEVDAKTVEVKEV